MLISVSIGDIRQNPQDTSNFYLANIYQTLAEPNRSSTPTSPPLSPPPFSPPNHAVWVNALWFMSLVMSLTCALLATLLQQWARRYLKITDQSRYRPHKHARIRAFFFEGVEKCLLPWTVDALPTLLHISLFLFFAGLVVFLCNVNLTIFKLVLSWVGLCTALYGCMTCVPIIRHDSPYYTPLSLPAWYVVTGIQLLVYRFVMWFNTLCFHTFHTSLLFIHVSLHFQPLRSSCRKSLAQGMQKTAEETALNSPSEIDARAFMWTFDCLDEDHELERFFSGLPGFRTSRFVKDPLPSLTEEEKWNLSEGLRGLLDRTFSSDLLPVFVKDRRAMICKKAIDPEHMFNVFVLHATLFKYQRNGPVLGPVAIAIADVLREFENNQNRVLDWDAQILAQADISRIIARRQTFDDSWYTLASNILGFPETSLRDYAAHGDSLSLVILIHFVRLQFTLFQKSYWPEYDFSDVLAEASDFDVKDTSPELQHQFCALWNQIINEVQGNNDRLMVHLILRSIRNVYLALHQDTDSAPTQFSTSTRDRDFILEEPSTYPVCKVTDHRSDSTPQRTQPHSTSSLSQNSSTSNPNLIPPNIHEDDVSMTPARAFSHDPNLSAVVPSLAIPDPPSSSTHAQFPVDETLINTLPLANQISDSVSTPAIGHTTTEDSRLPTTSPGPVTTCAMHGSIDPSRTTEPSTSSPSPMSSASAPPPAGRTAPPTGALLFSGRDSI